MVIMSTLAIHVLQSRADVKIGADSIVSCSNAGYLYCVVNNHNKDILTGRVVGYNETDAEYVSFVDDDDQTMLTAEHVSAILNKAKPALFTNSITSSNGIDRVQVPEIFKEWNLNLEKRGYIRPHQTIVYQKHVALELLKTTQQIISAKQWDRNDCDVLMRMLASISYGWDYLPEVTYKWNVHSAGEHFKRPQRIQEIRKYIFGN